VSPRRNTLGRRLALRIAASTTICLVLFTAIAVVVWMLVDDGVSGEIESPRGELIEQLVTAILIATPLGILTTTLAARWLTRRATERIDGVIATAARVSANDLTARLPVSDANDELDDLSTGLNRMLARIELGVVGQRQFAADASHELRTPLTAVKTELEVARSRSRTPDEWERVADRALRELDQMSALIEALLQLARIDAGARERTAVALGDVIERVRERFAPTGAARGITIEPTVAPELFAVADAAALEIAIGNLTANAIAHSPDRGVVALAAERDGSELRIDVADQGAGVPIDQRARIFEPFTRSEIPAADRRVAGAGVGLGLAIVRRIAEAHDGRIEVSDARGGGAQFTLRLPAPQTVDG
jgi:two-component system OmpR family sensor kinase